MYPLTIIFGQNLAKEALSSAGSDLGLMASLPPVCAYIFSKTSDSGISSFSVKMAISSAH